MNAAVDPAHKRRLLPWLRALACCGVDELPACLSALAHPSLSWHGPHPVGDLHGLEALARRFWRPLKLAFPDLDRRDDIMLGGAFTHPTLGPGDWVALAGHFVGTWTQKWLGLPGTGRLTFVRFSEFHRLDGGRVTESYVLLDLVDAMRQAGCNPLPPGIGAEGLVPGPATRDGVRVAASDPTESAASLRVVEDMMFGSLRRFDGANLDSMRLEPFWAPDMMRYSPCGLGSVRGIKAFQRDQQRPFLQAFPDRAVCDQRARVGDGPYVAALGWPGMRGTHRGGYLGAPATREPVAMHVIDFWRCERGALAESWFLLDLPHLMLQLGRDLMGEARELARG